MGDTKLRKIKLKKFITNEDWETVRVSDEYRRAHDRWGNVFSEHEERALCALVAISPPEAVPYYTDEARRRLVVFLDAHGGREGPGTKHIRAGAIVSVCRDIKEGWI